jgi:hypothetical protein
MKLIICFLITTLAFFYTSNAQVKIDPKIAKAVKLIMTNGKITGKLSYPKSIGAIENLESKLKEKSTAWAYTNGINGPKLAFTITQLALTNVTTANSPNYEFTYELMAKFPKDLPVEISFYAGCYICGSGGTDHLVFYHSVQGQLAFISITDNHYEGMNYVGESVHVVH